MYRIDADFQYLKPIAFEKSLEGKGIGFRCREAVEISEGRRVALSHKREDDAVTLLTGIGRVADLLVKIAVLWFCGLFQAFALDIEQPAVEWTAQTAILDPSETQVSTAVGAVPADQTVTTLIILEQNEFFPQETDRLDGVLAFQFLGQSRWLPVSTQNLATRCTRSAFGEKFVLFRTQHFVTCPLWQSA